MKRDHLNLSAKVGLAAAVLLFFVWVSPQKFFPKDSGEQSANAAAIAANATSSRAVPAAPKVVTTSVEVLVVGDIMLDRNVGNLINEKGFDSVFAGVRDIVSSADIAIGNLEGPFTSYPSRTMSLQSKELVFTFNPALAPKLAGLGFDIVGLANNHTLNFGKEGLKQTREYVAGAGMQYYGDPNNGVGTATSSRFISTVVEKNGIRIGLVGFHEFSYVGLDNVLAEIDRLRPQVDVLIVSPHWGVEYQKEPTSSMWKNARLFIDHGADAVIGAHPHVVGNTDEYQGKKIFYSLGNFAFDQYFSKATMNGLAIHISILKQTSSIEPAPHVSLMYSLIPIQSDRAGVRVATSTKAIENARGLEAARR